MRTFDTSSLEAHVRHAVTAVCVFLFATVAPATAGAAPIALQTFDDPHGWFFGGGPAGIPPTLYPIQLGGPSGPADPFLFVTSNGGGGPRSRLSAINTTELAGNYTAAGVSTISMDLRNFGTTDLSLRLLLLDFDEITGVPINGAVTSAAVFLPNSSGWQPGAFDVTAVGLTLVFGGSAAALLADVDELRIFHNPAPDFPLTGIPPISAALGVDNINTGAAPTAPEPGVVTLLFGGLAALMARRRRN